MKMILQKRDKVFAAFLALLTLLALVALAALIVILPVDWTLSEKLGSDVLSCLIVALVALLVSCIILSFGYSWIRRATLALAGLTLVLSLLAGVEFVHLLATWTPEIPSTTNPAQAHLGMWLGVLYAILGVVTCSLALLWLKRLGRPAAGMR